MGSDEEAVRRVVEAFERSDWSEIDVRFGPLRIRLSAGDDAHRPLPTEPAITPDAPSDVIEPDVSAAPSATDGDPADAPPGAHLVTSPSPGIFWRAPEPGARPFTDVGHHVDASSTICIVEVMKLMNHVKAGVSMPN